MPDKAQPGRAIATWFGSVMFGEDAADDIFVDLYTEGARDLLGDVHTAKAGVAPVLCEFAFTPLSAFEKYPGNVVAKRSDRVKRNAALAYQIFPTAFRR